MAQIVSIEKVKPQDDIRPVANWAVKKTMEVLERQGQIEPLQVWEQDGAYVIYGQEPYGAEILEAAKRLGWPTLLIVVMMRYEA
jgi:hypothetical protein